MSRGEDRLQRGQSKMLTGLISKRKSEKCSQTKVEEGDRTVLK